MPQSFSMSMYANQTDLYKAKAEYYEAKAKQAEEELRDANGRLQALEVHLLRVDNENRKLRETNDQLDRLANSL